MTTAAADRDGGGLDAWDAWCAAAVQQLAQDELVGSHGALATTDCDVVDALHDALEQLEGLMERHGASTWPVDDATERAGAAAMLAVVRAAHIVVRQCVAAQRQRGTEGGAA